MCFIPSRFLPMEATPIEIDTPNEKQNAFFEKDGNDWGGSQETKILLLILCTPKYEKNASFFLLFSFVRKLSLLAFLKY